MPLAFFASSVGRLLAVGVCIAMLLTGLYMEMRTNEHLRVDRDHIAAINEQNLATIDAERAAIKRANEIAAAEVARTEFWRQRYNVMRAEIVDATADEDGPVAPVLRRVLDRLPGPDSNKTGTVPAAGSTAKSHGVSRQP